MDSTKKKMSKSYRKWTIKDIRHIEQLRKKGFNWNIIGDLYSVSADTVSSMYRYHQSQIEANEDNLELATDRTYDWAEARFGITKKEWFGVVSKVSNEL